MVNPKKVILKKSWILLLYALIFPFGQLLSFRFSLGGFIIRTHPIDWVLLPTIYWAIRKNFQLHRIHYLLANFIAAAGFSLLVSVSFFEPGELFTGILYFSRLVGYFVFAVYIWNLIKEKIIQKRYVFKIIIAVCLTSAVFGWIQYLFLPNLVFLKYLGWDDHLYRMAGTFLDPGFLGLILVIGSNYTLLRYIKSRKSKYLLLSAFFILSCLFTYSRASYVSLFAGLISLGYRRLYLKKILLAGLILIAALVFLPRYKSEGTSLLRSRSIQQRVHNYKETLGVILKNPLFGVGYNNICAARSRVFDNSIESHACSGSDSSVLTILATTGVIGLLIFIGVVIGSAKLISSDIYGRAFVSSIVSVMVHSLFVNSLFYSWIMGLLAMGWGISLKKYSTRGS